MKALVTGATGFVGSSIVRELLRDGQEVRALVRKGADTRNLKGLDIELAEGDLRDASSIDRAVKGCNSVYHAAAMVYFWVPKKDVPLFYEINVNGTKRVCEAAMKHNVDKMVYTSTISTIGSYGKDNPTTEENSFNLWDMCMDYERSKYSAEFEAWRYAAKGLPLVAVLPAAPLGERDLKPNPIGKVILDFLGGKLPGYIDGGGNFIDVNDVARGHVLAGKRGKPGERYILGNQNLSVLEFFKIIEEVSGIKAPRMKAPYAVMLGLSHALEFVANRINKPPLATPSVVKFSSQYYYVDTRKAEAELGFKARTPIREAAAKAIDWFIDNQYLPPNEKAIKRMRKTLEPHLGMQRLAEAH